MKKPLKTTKPRDARINLRIASELRDRLAKLAEKDQRSLSSYIERVLSEHASGQQKTRE